MTERIVAAAIQIDGLTLSLPQPASARQTRTGAAFGRGNRPLGFATD